MYEIRIELVCFMNKNMEKKALFCVCMKSKFVDSLVCMKSEFIVICNRQGLRNWLKRLL